jgi:hypothetical protein
VQPRSPWQHFHILVLTTAQSSVGSLFAKHVAVERMAVVLDDTLQSHEVPAVTRVQCFREQQRPMAIHRLLETLVLSSSQ